MPGNDRPHGARRRPGSKKGPQVGTGGHRRKALEGRGPTPKAEDRPYHPKHKAKLRAEAKAALRCPQTTKLFVAATPAPRRPAPAYLSRAYSWRYPLKTTTA